MQPDPLGLGAADPNPQSASTAMSGRPVNFTDPTGLFWQFLLQPTCSVVVELIWFWMGLGIGDGTLPAAGGVMSVAEGVGGGEEQNPGTNQINHLSSQNVGPIHLNG